MFENVNNDNHSWAVFVHTGSCYNNLDPFSRSRESLIKCRELYSPTLNFNGMVDVAVCGCCFCLIVYFFFIFFSLTYGQTPSANAFWMLCSVSALAHRTGLSRTGSESVFPCSTWTLAPSCPGSCPCTSSPSWSPRACVAAPRSPGTGSFCRSRYAHFDTQLPSEREHWWDHIRCWFL